MTNPMWRVRQRMAESGQFEMGEVHEGAKAAVALLVLLREEDHDGASAMLHGLTPDERAGAVSLLASSLLTCIHMMTMGDRYSMDVMIAGLGLGAASAEQAG